VIEFRSGGDAAAGARLRTVQRGDSLIGVLALAFFLVETLAALLAVAAQGVGDDGVGFDDWADFIDFDRFALQYLVVLEETAQHEQAVRRHFVSFTVGAELRVFSRNGNDLVILLAAVDHRHQADGTSVNDRQRNDRFLAQHENVEWIVIFRECLRNESIIRRIISGRVQHAVEANQAASFVKFAFSRSSRRESR
jgi:hypothetical protein